MIDSWMLKYNLRNKKFVSIDLESSGLNYYYTRPFNIGINIYQNHQLIKSHDLYLKYPNYKISKEIAIKTHYNPEKIEKEGIEPKEAFEILKGVKGTVKARMVY